MMHDKSIEEIISRNKKLEDRVRNQLFEDLSKLLDVAFDLEKDKGHSPRLTSFYNHSQLPRNLKLGYEGCFVMINGKLYLTAGDPHADLTDPERSFMEETSKETFLEWVREKCTRTFDAYKHLVDYIQGPSIKITRPVTLYI